MPPHSHLVTALAEHDKLKAGLPRRPKGREGRRALTWERRPRPSWAKRKLSRSEWLEVVGNTSIFPTRLKNEMPRWERYAHRKWLDAKVPLPAEVAAGLSLGQRTMLIVVGHEEREHGHCDRSVIELAQRTGLSRSGFDKNRRLLVSLGFWDWQERRCAGACSLTNVISSNPDTEVGRAYRAWIDAIPSRSVIAESKVRLNDASLPDIVCWADWALPSAEAKVSPSGEYIKHIETGNLDLDGLVVPRGGFLRKYAGTATSRRRSIV